MTTKTTFKSTLFVYIHKNIKLFKFTKILPSKVKPPPSGYGRHDKGVFQPCFNK